MAEKHTATPQVQLRWPCLTCDKTGMIANPMWDEWFASGNSDAERGPMPTEAEEIPCGDCDGEGYTLSWHTFQIAPVSPDPALVEKVEKMKEAAQDLVNELTSHGPLCTREDAEQMNCGACKAVYDKIDALLAEIEEEPHDQT